MGIEVNGRVLDTDEEGFLLDPSVWDRTIAERIARIESLEMTQQRWVVVNFVREYYETHHSVPEARVLLKAMGERMGKERATRKYLYELFPYGYGQQACKIAGMTKPRKLMLDV
ncbi:MAG: TusE/DsrC/DsvC family sulfur relay protein [Gammaproteobacteria bacterium]|nr:TusE/DsrC/DsvC family sulfur relay protein [Gammaproteobacteria bacterium]